MKVLDQEVIREAYKQLADEKCRDQSTHDIDLQSFHAGYSSLPIRQWPIVTLGHCVHCGLPVHIPQFING